MDTAIDIALKFAAITVAFVVVLLRRRVHRAGRTARTRFHPGPAWSKPRRVRRHTSTLRGPAEVHPQRRHRSRQINALRLLSRARDRHDGCVDDDDRLSVWTGDQDSLHVDHDSARDRALRIGLLYVLGVTSIGVYGIMLAGWSSNNKYSLMGGLRSSAQMISYELALGLSLIGVILLAGTLDLAQIVELQSGWHGFRAGSSFFNPWVSSFT